MEIIAYLDCYAGSGQSRIPDTNEILLGSPLIALSLDVQFDHYVFCEKNQKRLEACKNVSPNDFLVQRSSIFMVIATIRPFRLAMQSPKTL